MSELKPCPFCGEILDTIPNRSIWDIVTFYEHPNNPECQLSGLLFSENWWNTRAIEDALNKRITELEQENARLREELQKLKRKEKPIRFDSLADWRRE